MQTATPGAQYALYTRILSPESPADEIKADLQSDVEKKIINSRGMKMLFWTDDGNEVTEVSRTHKKFYAVGVSRLSADEQQNIKSYINTEIDKVLDSDGEKAFVPGWHVKKDWNGTPLQAIHNKAFPGDKKSSALWFGLACMEVIMDRGERWFALKSNFNREFDQTVYWKSQD